MTTPDNTPMHQYLVEAIPLSISDEELDRLERFAHAHYAGEGRRTLDDAITEQRHAMRHGGPTRPAVATLRRPSLTSSVV